MTRYREKSQNGIYLISSYIVRTECDLKDKKTKKLFNKVVRRAKKRFNFEFSKLQVKKNSFVMLVKPKNGKGESIPEYFQWIKSVFAKLWNSIHKMHGAFWADRFDSELIFKDLDDVTSDVPIIDHFLNFFIVYAKKLHEKLKTLQENFIPLLVHST
ncbi:hypothetical protein FACS189494_01440 [Spirochaetia bacterium]|nr:hypothetical protein FACS189494_01440 [Spirochaetia bacterium]